MEEKENNVTAVTKKSNNGVKAIAIFLVLIAVIAPCAWFLGTKLANKSDNTNTNKVVEKTPTKTDDEDEVKALCLKSDVKVDDRVTYDLFEECDKETDAVISSPLNVDLEESVYYSSVNVNKGETYRLEDLYWLVATYKPGDKWTLFSYDSGIDLVFTNNKINITFANNSTNKEQLVFNEAEIEYASIYETSDSGATLLIKSTSGNVYYVYFKLDADQEGNTIINSIGSGQLGVTNPKGFYAVDATSEYDGIPCVMDSNNSLLEIRDFD